MKTVTEAREALERKTVQLRTWARQRRPSASVDAQEDNVMAAADVLGDARELRGHVGACLDCYETIAAGWQHCDAARRLIDGND